MALSLSNIQQLGGWPFEQGVSAVSCTVTVDADNENIPIAELGFRRLRSMWVQSSSISGVTVRLLGRAVQSPYDNNTDFCLTATGTQTAPALYVTADGSPLNVELEADVIFVGEV